MIETVGISMAARWAGLGLPNGDAGSAGGVVAE
jgi:hypothetical protein